MRGGANRATRKQDQIAVARIEKLFFLSARSLEWLISTCVLRTLTTIAMMAPEFVRLITQSTNAGSLNEPSDPYRLFDITFLAGYKRERMDKPRYEFISTRAIWNGRSSSRNSSGGNLYFSPHLHDMIFAPHAG